MRCLYCGKEPALFKRWTAGEFCSDAHRKRYQEEYNQLALSRLMQAKPPTGSETPAHKKPLESKKSEEAPPPAWHPMPTVPLEAPAAISVSEPMLQSSFEPPLQPEQEVVSAKESVPPELAGFLVHLPIPAAAGVAAIAGPERDLVRHATPVLPALGFGDSATLMTAPKQIALELTNRCLDYRAGPHARRLEVREFLRTTPLVEVDLRARTQIDLGISEDALEMQMFPHAPQTGPALWHEPQKEFPAIPAELGSLARLAFPDEGFEEIEDRVHQEEEQAPIAAAHVIVAEPPCAAPPIPELITKPLPLTLHGIAAGKGKAVQVFSSVVPSGTDPQIPRSNALPLRPLMTFGPPPAKPTPSPAKPASTQIPARVIPIKTEAARQPHAAPEPAKEARKPESKPAPVQEAPKKPAQALTDQDLGLPKLSLQSSETFWSRLPILGKIGLTAVAVLAVAGAIMYAMKNSNGAAAFGTGPAVEIGPALIAETGWITDWAGEQGARSARQISILRPSTTLTDYRVQFEGQIETKAIGWVFRAMNPKNFYVVKLEIVKPGLNPTVALIRFPVINGEEQPHAQFPLQMPLRLDTMYKIRFDAVGDHFTTWVQDQKVDEWTDDRIKTGGVGLYSERGETSTLKGGFNVVPLVLRR